LGSAFLVLIDRRIIEVAMGTVKWFNPTIKADDGGADVFVHIPAVEKGGYTTLVGVPRLAMS
jgi:hypothetical protein